MPDEELALMSADTCLDLILCIEDVATVRELGVPRLRTFDLLGTCKWGHGTQTAEITRWPGEDTYPSSFPCHVTPKAGGTCSDISVEACVETTVR